MSVELLISRLLRVGVVLSLALVVTGSGVRFVHHHDYASSPEELQRLTSPGAAFPHTLSAVADGLRSGQGQAIVAVGLLLLILTPVIRVGVSIAAFALERDWAFGAITTLVFALLILSFLLGKAL
jgi:uncharacterized membrane protein